MGSFSEDLGKFRAKSIDDVDRKLRGISLSLFNSIILKTPVDTGRARGNWQIDTSQSKTAGLVRITNNVPYIVILEYGDKNRKPVAMVRTSILEIQTNMKNF